MGDEVRGGRSAIDLGDFAEGYLDELRVLQDLVNEAERLALADAHA